MRHSTAGTGAFRASTFGREIIVERSRKLVRGRARRIDAPARFVCPRRSAGSSPSCRRAVAIICIESPTCSMSLRVAQPLPCRGSVTGRSPVAVAAYGIAKSSPTARGGGFGDLARADHACPPIAPTVSARACRSARIAEMRPDGGGWGVGGTCVRPPRLRLWSRGTSLRRLPEHPESPTCRRWTSRRGCEFALPMPARKPASGAHDRRTYGTVRRFVGAGSGPPPPGGGANGVPAS